MIVDQAIETRPTRSDGRLVTVGEVRQMTDEWLADVAEQIRIEDLTATPRQLFKAADEPAPAPVVPIRKSDALRATWGLQAAREMGDQ